MKPRSAGANASTVTRSRIFVILGVVPREIGEQIERAGDENRAVLARAGERRGRIGLDLDLGEVPLRRAVRAPRPAARGRSTTSSRRARGPVRASAASIASASLSRRIETHERVVGAVEPRGEPRGAVRVVRAVPNLVAAPLEPARQRDLDLARRPDGRGTPPPPRARRRRGRSARRGRRTPRPGARQSFPPERPRASRPRSPRASRPSTSVCSRPTFVSRTTCERRTFVASSRPPRPASTTAASTSRAANSANAAAQTASNCVAPCASASGLTRRARPRSRPPRRRP